MKEWREISQIMIKFDKLFQTLKENGISQYSLYTRHGYNAPSTMSHYYQQEVQHDMYGGGGAEKGITFFKP